MNRVLNGIRFVGQEPIKSSSVLFGLDHHNQLLAHLKAYVLPFYSEPSRTANDWCNFLSTFDDFNHIKDLMKITSAYCNQAFQQDGDDLICFSHILSNV
jgi:hypothetical protein